MRYEVNAVFKDAVTDPPKKKGTYAVIIGYKSIGIYLDRMAYYPGAGWNCLGPDDKPVWSPESGEDRYIWLWCEHLKFPGKFLRMIKKITDEEKER